MPSIRLVASAGLSMTTWNCLTRPCARAGKVAVTLNLQHAPGELVQYGLRHERLKPDASLPLHLGGPWAEQHRKSPPQNCGDKPAQRSVRAARDEPEG